MAGFQGVDQELKSTPSPQPSPINGRGSNREKQFINPAIIGGGYAGMAAAVALAERGIPVTVFESARQLGGRARGVLHNDTQLDNGQHLLLGCYRQTLHLIEQVGGNLEQDFLRLPLQLDLHGEFSLRAPRLPAPLHLLVALLNAQGISFGERIKAARFMLALRRANFHLTIDMTVAELLAKHGQDAELAQKLWEPLCIAALNTPIHKASAQVLLNVLRDALNRSRADSDMLLPRVDFTALFPQRAASYIEQRGGKVLTSCRVEAIVPRIGGIELASAEKTHTFSHVICAAPPVVAAKLLRPLAALENTVAQIDGLEHQPIYTVYLQYPAHVALPHPMLGLHRRFSQWLFDKGRIAGQHGLLAAVISAEGIHQELAQEQLAQKVVAELREEFGIAEPPHWFKVIAEKRATFCCAPNLQRPTQQTALPGLLLAGDYTAGDYPATLEGAVLSGLRCASLISA
ncbi:MAG: hydroxysqualene dehydroxylase HpnE [Gallionella sp.]|nr:hydroxysqualene dehydroxylase HpnE [Gallionella sp.]